MKKYIAKEKKSNTGMSVSIIFENLSEMGMKANKAAARHAVFLLKSLFAIRKIPIIVQELSKAVTAFAAKKECLKT